MTDNRLPALPEFGYVVEIRDLWQQQAMIDACAMPLEEIHETLCQFFGPAKAFQMLDAALEDLNVAVFAVEVGGRFTWEVSCVELLPIVDVN